MARTAPTKTTKKKTTTKLAPLTPPDPRRCQVLKPNGHNFMTFGGTPGRVRCPNVPTVIATERKPDAHGRRGAMSLCGDCQAVLQRVDPHLATFAPIPPPAPWDDCKVAFGVDDDDALDRAERKGQLRLPAGWKFDELDGTGGRFVAVFRVDGVPRAEDGVAVHALLVKLGATAAEKA